MLKCGTWWMKLLRSSCSRRYTISWRHLVSRTRAQAIKLKCPVRLGPLLKEAYLVYAFVVSWNRQTRRTKALKSLMLTETFASFDKDSIDCFRAYDCFSAFTISSTLEQGCSQSTNPIRNHSTSSLVGCVALSHVCCTL